MDDEEYYVTGTITTTAKVLIRGRDFERAIARAEMYADFHIVELYDDQEFVWDTNIANVETIKE